MHHLNNEEGGQSFLSKYSPPDKPNVIDAAHLFMLPHRMNCPDILLSSFEDFQVASFVLNLDGCTSFAYDHVRVQCGGCH